MQDLQGSAGMYRLHEELLRRVRHFELAGPARWVPNNRLLGLQDLALRVTNKGEN